MATTAKGTPYVVSTDLVANYPTVSSDLATHIDAKLAYNAVTINAQTGTSYTFALSDASEGKLVTASNAAASTYTVPPQSSVTWAAGAVLRILNQGAGTVTIAAGSGVTINGTPLTLAQYKGAAIQRTAADTWTFIPFSGGVGNAVISDTPTGSYTGYQYWTFTASGTLNVTTAGFADVLVVAGGGGGGEGTFANNLGAGGGGGGAHIYATNYYIPTGSLTVTVGGGGAGATTTSVRGANGSFSRFADVLVVGGGGGGSLSAAGSPGGHGGGGSSPSHTTGSVGLTDGGNAGGNADTNGGGGGGGGGGVGGNGSSNTGGTGGAGVANSITGTSVSRQGGGGGGGFSGGGTSSAGGGAGGLNAAGTSGTANSGGGGGGGGNGDGGNGGSGIVIVRVAV